DLGWRTQSLRDQPLFLRIQFHTPQTKDATEPKTTTTYVGLWEIGPPETPRRARKEMSLSPATFHEFPIPPNLWDEKGILAIDFQNQNNTALYFPLDEGFEVLYREGGFGLNFFRGVTIIFFWLALLAAMGLAAASFLSFPVAAFLAMGLLLVGLSTSTLTTVVQEGAIFGANHEGGQTRPTFLDHLIVPVFRLLLELINLVQSFSPIDSLSLGRSITWVQLARAFVQICVLMSGIFSLIGIVVLTRRELATAQSQH